ncbi:hypothetical protein ACJJTC_006566 [Scirpophaga incertulas]
MSHEAVTYPLEVKEFEPEEMEEVYKRFVKAPPDTYVRVGPKGYVLFKGFLNDAPKIYNFSLRPDDIWIVTFPKSGTTWVQELVWMVANDCDYEGSDKTPLTTRFPFLEASMFYNNKFGRDLAEEYSKSDDKQKQLLAAVYKRSNVDICDKKPSPRFIKTHLPLSLLPPALLNTCKVVHVARDPRDVAVSYYHHNTKTTDVGYKIEMKQLWNLFINDQLEWTPYFENVKESWAMRHHPNMLFLFYEDLLKDLPSAVKQVAKFLGKTMTEEQISRLCTHLSFDNFKNNKSVNGQVLIEANYSTGNLFVNKGKSGAWREYFDEEMKLQATKWMEDNLRDSDLTFSNE